VSLIRTIPLIGIGAVLIAVAVVTASPTMDLPFIPGLTEETVYADVTIETWISGTGGTGINEMDVVTYDRNTMMTLPFGAWFPHTSFDGVLTVKAMDGNNNLIDQKTKDVDYWAHLGDVRTDTWSLNGLRLGVPGDGTIVIIAELWDTDGQRRDHQSTFRDI